MLEKLEQILGYKLGEMAHDVSRWDSIIINKRKPYTYRAFTMFEDVRISLHKFDPCDKTESFYHPHPWPGAFCILKGGYEMELGISPDRFSEPKDVCKTIMRRNSRYEIVDPLVWHKITPLETTYTVMINSPPWDSNTAHTQIRTTQNKNLGKIDDKALQKHLSTFRTLLYRLERK